MDDRKRSVPHETSDEPPTKRQALATSQPSHNVPQSQEDVVHFQKEAIWRQMQEYKRERNLLETRVEELNKKSKYHDDHLRITDAWWDQFLDEVRIAAGDYKSLSKPTQNGDSSPPQSSLMFEEVASFSEHLSKKRSKIINTVTHIFKNLKSGAGTESEKVETLQSQLGEMLAKEKVREVELARLRQEKDDANTRLTDATIKFMNAAKRLDRLKSQTVQKIERQAMHQATSSAGGGDGGEATGGTDEDGVRVSEGQLADLEQARKEAEAVANKQKEELQKLQTENSKLSSQVTDFTIKLGKLSEEDVLNCDIYKNLKLKLEDIVARYNHIEAMNKSLREEAAKLQAERKTFKDTVENEHQVVLMELQSQLTRAEHDVARIRTARDQFREELMQRKNAEEPSEHCTKQLMDLAEVRQTRVQSLEAEIARLRTQLEEGKIAVTEDVRSMSHDELAEKYQKLDRAFHDLSQELAPLEAAYKRAHELSTRKVMNLADREEKIAKLSAEKSKVDTKYFQEFSKREHLHNENRVLKAQNQRSSEIITQLKEAEKAANHLVANLNKQLSEFKQTTQALKAQVQEAQSKSKEHLNTIETLKRQVADLSTHLKSKDTQIAKESTARREYAVEAERLKVKLDEANRALSAERNKGSENDQVEALRQLCICSICSIRWKQVAIRTCGHMFCKQCADERISSRMRKCPNCGLSFSSNDVFPVHM